MKMMVNLRVLLSGLLAAALLAPVAASAVPSFARQTGLSCAMCHTVFPQLTPYGRMFKLSGYTLAAGMFNEQNQQSEKLSEDTSAPLSAMLQVSATSMKSGAAGANTPGDYTDFPQQFSLFYAGRISDNVGAFVQATLDNANQIAMDNADVRMASSTTTAGGKQLVYGLSLNNAPTVEDILNTTPVWATFPSATSPHANFPSGPLLLGSDNVNTVTAGAVAYAMYDNTWYGAAGMYHNAAGGGAVGIKGWAPYLRVAYEHENATSNYDIGAYAMNADMSTDPNDTSLPKSSVSDTGVDAQYQYISGPHTFTGRANYIAEKIDNAANLGGSKAGSVKVNQFNLNGTYYYDRKYGGSLGYFTVSGDADGLWGGGKPDSNYWMAEYDYVPWLNTKFSLQYTAYTKFNGTTANASDNNALYALAWFMF